MARGLKAEIRVNAYAPVIETNQVARIKAELEGLGVSVCAKRNDDLAYAIDGDGSISGAADFDFCVYLDKDKYNARLIERVGARLFNSSRAIELCDDKMKTHIALAGSGIPMPETVPGILCYGGVEHVPEHVITEVEKRLGYPVVVKGSYGSQGKSVFRADDRAQLCALADSLITQPHLFQRYIAQSAGRDLRVIVIGDRVIGGMLRSSKTDFRSNIGLGGSAQKADVPEEVARYALTAARILGLDYCGIDFLLSPSPMLIEVNSNAFFDAFEKATGVNVAGLYAKHMVDTMNSL